MRRYILLFLFALLISCFPRASHAQDTAYTIARIINGDTVPIIQLPEVWVFAPMKFKNKREKKRYTRLMRNIKKVYPYAKLAGMKLRQYESLLLAAETDKERRRLMKQAEKELKEEYGEDLKNLTFSQGRILLKLVDRETGNSTFVLVQELRGKFLAFFWQSFAKIFGYDLKVKYDPEGKDRAIENIVVMIEQGLI